MAARDNRSSSMLNPVARWRSLRYALAGCRDLLADQPHARLHLLAAVLVVALAFWARFERLEWVLLLLTVALVWCAEALNSALEYLADATMPEQHPLVRKAKDVAAAGVLFCALAALGSGALLFGPRLLAWLA